MDLYDESRWPFIVEGLTHHVLQFQENIMCDPPGSNVCNLSLRYALDLNDCAISWRKRLQARTRWHGLGEEVNVDLIHSREILHVCKVDIVLDHLFKR